MEKIIPSRLFMELLEVCTDTSNNDKQYLGKIIEYIIDLQDKGVIPEGEIIPQSIKNATEHWTLETMRLKTKKESLGEEALQFIMDIKEQ